MRKTRAKIRGKEGFTLLELLIVITILVILSALLVFILNPAETLKKSRDAQRISDLSTLKNTVALYITATSTAEIAGSGNTGCRVGSYTSGDAIYYSYPSTSPGATITDTAIDGSSGGIPSASQVSNASLRKVDGTGWLPVNLGSLAGGSPIAALPVDPLNTIASVSNVQATDSVYRYACDSTDTTFEIDANLESATYTTAPNNYEVNDGGSNSSLYEVGTKLTILGEGTDF